MIHSAFPSLQQLVLVDKTPKKTSGSRTLSVTLSKPDLRRHIGDPFFLPTIPILYQPIQDISMPISFTKYQKIFVDNIVCIY